MTGFGRGAVSDGEKGLNVMVRTYNARFLEIKIRGLTLVPEIEAAVRDKINKTLVRGTVHVTIEKNQDVKQVNVSFNRQRFEAVENVLHEIQKDYGRSLDMSSLLSFDDTVQRVTLLAEQLSKIEGLSDGLVAKHKEKLHKRISELMDKANMDEQRFAQEVAILVDRSDISEELVRIRSHIDQFNTFLFMDEPTGKRLSFLLQELGREINTVGSKSGTGDIINIVVNFKNHLEKIREQIQNVL
jgi:uncharacterized protein YicC (UPF0701 family)